MVMIFINHKNDTAKKVLKSKHWIISASKLTKALFLEKNNGWVEMLWNESEKRKNFFSSCCLLFSKSSSKAVFFPLGKSTIWFLSHAYVNDVQFRLVYQHCIKIVTWNKFSLTFSSSHSVSLGSSSLFPSFRHFAHDFYSLQNMRSPHFREMWNIAEWIGIWLHQSF